MLLSRQFRLSSVPFLLLAVPRTMQIVFCVLLKNQKEEEEKRVDEKVQASKFFLYF